MRESAADAEAPQRIDRWLFAVRFFKSRSIAADAVAGGKVHVNGERVRASKALKPGDRVSFMRGAVVFECVVQGLPLRRGPAREAVRSYAETTDSEARRSAFSAQLRAAAAMTPKPEGRPDKHQRRTLRRLRGRD